MIPTCPYCGQPATFKPHSDHIYRLDYGPVWQCVPCAAWVGCHRGTRTPLGRLADAELRRAKIAAHEAFDRIWKHGKMSRHMAYHWLAKEMRIQPKACHIGMFGPEECARVIEVCKTVAEREAGRPSTRAMLAGVRRGKR